MRRHWVLVGLMGSGKTTVGALLAQRSARPFFDNDVQLNASEGRTAREVQADLGFDALHALEAHALIDALDTAAPAVIAAAASVVDDPELRGRLRDDAVVIWLTANTDELSRRVVRQHHRPIAPDVASQLRDQSAARSQLFGDLADVVIDARRPPGDLVDELLPRLTAG
ncbi:MAG: shikimate kinase [Acidimicrobiaceae bacterium]